MVITVSLMGHYSVPLIDIPDVNPRMFLSLVNE